MYGLFRANVHAASHMLSERRTLRRIVAAGTIRSPGYTGVVMILEKKNSNRAVEREEVAWLNVYKTRYKKWKMEGKTPTTVLGKRQGRDCHQTSPLD